MLHSFQFLYVRLFQICIFVCLITQTTLLAQDSNIASKEHPNVVFISVDDSNDWLKFFLLPVWEK